VRESTIERHLVERVKALGGEVRKVKWIGRRGAPDRLVMLPERVTPWDGTIRPGAICLRNPLKHAARSVWVELKAPGVPPEAHQVREHERMRKMGQRVVVIDSIEGVEALLA
jgi:hypothetical protein